MRITGTKTAAGYLRGFYDNNGLWDREHFTITILDRDYNVIETRDISQKAIRVEVSFSMDKVMRIMNNENAYAVLICHNHPLSGFTSPSSADITVTRKIKKECSLRGKRLLDHIILSKDGWYSFSHSGMLEII